MWNDRKIKVAVSGKSGCGNSTVSRLVAEYLGFKLINYTFRNIAEEKGISFDELWSLAQGDPSYDLYLDKKQVELAEDGNCVLGSRLAIWMLKDADLKVYIKASPEVRARRIQKREGGTFEEVLAKTVERDARDSKRYMAIYGIDNDDHGFADLIIDSDDKDQEEVAEIIANEVRALLKRNH